MSQQDLKKRAARLWKAIKVGKVLSDLGYEVDPYDPSDQQFSCDLHGSEDHDPSAHLYYEQNAWHCFGCGKKRDAVQTIIDKKKKTFTEAIEYLETKYNIQPLSLPTELIEKIEGTEKDFSDMRRDIEQTLLYLTINRYVGKQEAVTFWAKFDKLCSSEFRKTYPEDLIKNYLIKLKLEVMNNLIVD